ncbi:hypothetical protein A9Z06_20030 [Rhizobium sp. YK2]|nr:hypothetical protein A9Z06_20030 [Rhizobium sp. YK2]
MAAVPSLPFVSMSTTPENPERGLDAILFHLARAPRLQMNAQKAALSRHEPKHLIPFPHRKRDALGKMRVLRHIGRQAS